MDDLHGNVEFSDQQIEHVTKHIDEAGIVLPSFSTLPRSKAAVSATHLTDSDSIIQDSQLLFPVSPPQQQTQQSPPSPLPVLQFDNSMDENLSLEASETVSEIKDVIENGFENRRDISHSKP